MVKSLCLEKDMHMVTSLSCDFGMYLSLCLCPHTEILIASQRSNSLLKYLTKGLVYVD